VYAYLTSSDFLSWGEIGTILEDNKIILHGHDSIAINGAFAATSIKFPQYIAKSGFLL
jgi:hypothetical protein